MNTKVFAMVAVGLLSTVSCTKNEKQQEENMGKTEIVDGNLQTQVVYKSEKGEELKVTYFADGDVAGAKVQLGTAPERVLKASFEGHSHAPTFTDGKVSWTVRNENTSGVYTDEKGEEVIYSR